MFENIKADLSRYTDYGYNRGPVFMLFDMHQIWAIICYRYGNYLCHLGLPRWLRLFPMAFYHLWWKLIQTTCGIYISCDATIGKGLYIGHFGQIFIGDKVVIGANCNLSQGVTLGIAERGGKWGVPVLGDRVYLAPGSIAIGPICLGDGVVIGANTVMSKDAPENSVWAGIPARLIGYSGSEKYIGGSNMDTIEQPECQ